MKHRHLIRAAVAVGLALATPVAEAESRPACADRTLVVQRLADKYGETLKSMGLHQDNRLLEIYASDTTGTWTILVSKPDGQACLLAAGQMWEPQVTPVVKPGKDA
jgi:hypothetical protein